MNTSAATHESIDSPYDEVTLSTGLLLQEDRFDSVVEFGWALRVAAHSVIRGHARPALARTATVSQAPARSS